MRQQRIQHFTDQPLLGSGQCLQLFELQRYYDPAIGRFLSADPMASDMQNGWNFNRYAYGRNSPYMFLDPDGRVVDFVSEGGDQSFVDKGRAQWDHAKANAPPAVRQRMEHMENSKYVHVVRPLSESNYRQAHNQAVIGENESNGVGTGTVTYYDPDHSYKSGGVDVGPVDTLVHEVAGHGYDKDVGQVAAEGELDPSTGNSKREQSALDVQNEYRRHNGQEEIKKH